VTLAPSESLTRLGAAGKALWGSAIRVVDDDGYLHVLNRRTDLIISGGENIYPAEVESVLLSHPGVQEAAVVGVPHPDWGQRPVAFVVPRGASDGAAADELAAHCAANLARYKCPDTIHFVDALPRTAAGKLQHHLLREPVSSDERPDTPA
jgi:O-succinylbenzoic acid--CoA ligase